MAPRSHRVTTSLSSVPGDEVPRTPVPVAHTWSSLSVPSFLLLKPSPISFSAPYLLSPLLISFLPASSPKGSES